MLTSRDKEAVWTLVLKTDSFELYFQLQRSDDCAPWRQVWYLGNCHRFQVMTGTGEEMKELGYRAMDSFVLKD
jgi:hypothetical protein